MTVQLFAPVWHRGPESQEQWDDAFARFDILFGGIPKKQLDLHKNDDVTTGPYTLGPYITGDKYPEWMYAHGKGGERVTVFDFQKMRLADMTNPEVRKFLIDWTVKKAAGFTTFFVDSVGAAPTSAPDKPERVEAFPTYKLGWSPKSYVSHKAVDPRTGEFFTAESWTTLMALYLSEVSERFPGNPGFANGLQNPANFPSTKALLSADLSGMIEELAIRKPGAAPDYFPTTAQLEEEWAMWAAVRKTGKAILIWVKMWSEVREATQAEIDAMGRYAYAAVAMVADDGYYLNYTDGKNKLITNYRFDSDLTGLGPASGKKWRDKKNPAIFHRKFSNKVLDFNTETHEVTVRNLK